VSLSTEQFNSTIDSWIITLEQYNFAQLCLQPSPEAWSMGQLFMHLILSTDYFIDQALACSQTNDNSGEDSSPAARRMFQHNEFPDMIIEGPESNNHTPQPKSKEQIIQGLLQLKEKIKIASSAAINSSFKGKTKHPGLMYFNAAEWLQFAEMHMRHHFRQKQRLDEFLSKQS
jgi:hypothetical protein